MLRYVYMFVWYSYSQFPLGILCIRKSSLERKLYFFESSEYRGAKLRILPNIPRRQIFSEIKHLTSSSHSVAIYQELEPNVTWIHILWSQCGVIPLVLIHNTVVIHNTVLIHNTESRQHGNMPVFLRSMACIVRDIYRKAVSKKSHLFVSCNIWRNHCALTGFWVKPEALKYCSESLLGLVLSQSSAGVNSQQRSSYPKMPWALLALTSCSWNLDELKLEIKKKRNWAVFAILWVCAHFLRALWSLSLFRLGWQNGV